MKCIILAAGYGIDNINQGLEIPKCLMQYDEERTVFDITLENLYANDITEVIIIGGFGYLQFMEKYRGFRTYYNKDWETNGNLFSLLLAEDEFDDDLLICYSDIVVHNDAIKNLIKQKRFAISIDSQWKDRYAGREKNKNLGDAEKVYRYADNTYYVGKQATNAELIGEFTGLLFLDKEHATAALPLIRSLVEVNKKTPLTALITSLSKQSNMNLSDLHGNWAELDSLQDMQHFQFGTKAETLQTLQSQVTKSIILDQVTFSVQDYFEDPFAIISKIQKEFKSPFLVVRSSALNEDTKNSSKAGNYESILKVPINHSVEVRQSIELVINSYLKDGQEQNPFNQVLVQPFLNDVQMSGVVFTKNLQTSSPYYTINYDMTNNTESITSGMSEGAHTFVCYRNFSHTIDNPHLSNLLNAIQEIEQITKFDSIDIEFAIVNNRVYILQVRPIAANKETLMVSENDISIEINALKGYLKTAKRGNPNLVGSKVAYGVMPDWNPAEIIGINPSPLAFSLYKYIITDHIWAQSRKEMGYRDVTFTPGIVSFAGKPYVDIKMSFNSFIPSTLRDDIAEKLVDFFIQKLFSNPENHDKVEFYIVLTAYDFDFDSKIDELKEYGFSEEDINAIILSYKMLTTNIIKQKNVSIKNELNKVNILEERRNKILSSQLTIVDKIIRLLEDCKVYGTLPFSNLARFGFVGSILLKSMLSKNCISEQQYDDFFQTIHTVAKSFVDDLVFLNNGAIRKEEFINKYGHLRPGTYDITSMSYKENFDNYIDLDQTIKAMAKTSYEFSIEKMRDIQIELDKHTLDIDVAELFSFIKDATEARELAKFEFTKNLSAAIDLIAEFTSEHGFSREEASFLSIYDILKFSGGSSSIGVDKELKNIVKTNRFKHLITSAIQLPELIFEEKDIDMFFYPQLKPNFVTHIEVIAELAELNEHSNDKDISDKIVCIEHADPGYDWIFSHSIKGLVTKYGGAASHMAIRCAEFDIPAAIGCGDKIYNDLLSYRKIQLNCLNNQIKGLH